jgi:hypothetical protein
MAIEHGMEHFSDAEALTLAATVPIGRVVYSRYALPAVFVVNFKLDGQDVVFRTRKGPMFGAGVAGSVVAFEVDRIDEKAHDGWMVTFLGRAKLITDPAEQVRLAALDVESWAPGERNHFVKVVTEKIRGGRIPHSDDEDED